MKILLKLFGAASFVSLIAATPTMATTAEDSLGAARVAAPAQVVCGANNRIWTDGEILGSYHADSRVKLATKIIENRIYMTMGGVVEDNTALLLHMTGSILTGDVDALMKACVNGVDPSTFTNGYLKPATPQGTPCNGKIIPKDFLIATYIGDDRVNWFNYSRIIDGRLRMNWNKQGDPISLDQLGTGFFTSIIRGDNGSDFNPALGFKLNAEEIQSCFWNQVPKPSTMQCSENPVVQGTSNVTKTSLNFSYSGNTGSNFTWRIRSNNNVVRSGTATPNNGNGNIGFDQLGTGNYTLEIEAITCKSLTSFTSFSITDAVLPCGSGPSITDVKNINTTSLTVDFSGSISIPNISWVIKSGAEVKASGKTAGLSIPNTANISYGYLPNGSYTLEIQGGDCTSGVSSRNFQINVADNRPNCQAGPVLYTIYSPSETGLRFDFYGEEVYGIDWRIRSGRKGAGGAVVRQGSIAPQSSQLTLSYSPIQTGVYTLEIEGGSCKSVGTLQAREFGVNTSLPIYISDFEAKTIKKGIELSWNVVSEKGGEGFEILRLDDKLKTTEIVGKLPLTEQRVGLYKFLDESPVSGTNYYQLKQIDSDGSFTKSKVISAKFENIYEALIAPNPARDYIDVQFDSRISGPSVVEIYNIAGIKIAVSQMNVKEGKNTHRINVGKMADGYYVVKVLNEDKGVNLRFIKNN